MHGVCVCLNNSNIFGKRMIMLAYLHSSSDFKIIAKSRFIEPQFLFYFIYLFTGTYFVYLFIYLFIYLLLVYNTEYSLAYIFILSLLM